MKALILEQYLNLVYRDVPDPQLEPGEVLVKVEACGICGSDVQGMDGSTGRRVPPIIMGHEASGTIAQLGPEVTGWQEGERVTFDCVVPCGACHFCLHGRPNLCDRRTWIGVSSPGFRRHGAFAEYVAVPQQVLYRMPAGLSFTRAAFMEALSTALHAVKRSQCTMGDTAVVIGAGTIGLLIIQLLRAAGCSQIFVVDLTEAKLKLANQFGADAGFISGSEKAREVIEGRTGGKGVDIAFDAVGRTSSVEVAASLVRKGGGLCLVGNFQPMIEFPLADVVFRELTLYGSINAAGEQADSLQLLATQAIKVDELISAVAPLSQGGGWFERLYKREPGLIKVLLIPDQG